MSLDEVQHQASAQPLLMIPEARPGEAAEPAEMTAAQRMAVQVRVVFLVHVFFFCSHKRLGLLQRLLWRA